MPDQRANADLLPGCRWRTRPAVHFRFDGEYGVASGRAMAENAATRFVRAAGTAGAALISSSFADIHQTCDSGRVEDFDVSPTRDQAVKLHFSSSDGAAHYVIVPNAFPNGRSSRAPPPRDHLVIECGERISRPEGPGGDGKTPG